MNFFNRSKKDPPPRRGGGCATCGNQRPPIAVSNKDSFCSSQCCRTWHKVNDEH
jgi:hypothetical protein